MPAGTFSSTNRPAVSVSAVAIGLPDSVSVQRSQVAPGREGRHRLGGHVDDRPVKGNLARRVVDRAADRGLGCRRCTGWCAAAPCAAGAVPPPPQVWPCRAGAGCNRALPPQLLPMCAAVAATHVVAGEGGAGAGSGRADAGAARPRRRSGRRGSRRRRAFPPQLSPMLPQYWPPPAMLQLVILLLQLEGRAQPRRHPAAGLTAGAVAAREHARRSCRRRCRSTGRRRRCSW